MSKNNVFMFQLLAFFLVSNVWLKIIVIFTISINFLKKQFDKEKRSKIIKDMVYGIFILMLNCLININAIVLNFVYFNFGSLCAYKLKMKIDKYCSVYLLFILIMGVMQLW